MSTYYDYLVNQHALATYMEHPSFVIPEYAYNTPIYCIHANIDRIYTEMNSNNCNILHYYQYLSFLSDNDHGSTC